MNLDHDTNMDMANTGINEVFWPIRIAQHFRAPAAV